MPFAQWAFDLVDHRAHLNRLPAFGGGRSVIGSLNKDGYPDIVFCNYIHNYPGLRNAYVYWGGPDGYSASNRLELPNWAGGVAALRRHRSRLCAGVACQVLDSRPNAAHGRFPVCELLHRLLAG